MVTACALWSPVFRSAFAVLVGILSNAPVTAAAFAALVVLAGLNFVAIRFSNRELPPFEAASVRFAVAGLFFLAYARMRRISLPRGRALAGAASFGLLAFFGAYAFLYWGLVAAPAGMASVALALVPLMTVLLAAVHGLERPLLRTFVGGALTTVGIAVVFGDQLAAQVPILFVASLLAGAACAAESNVIVKYFPRSHPAATNAVAMPIGALALAALSLLVREPWAMPSQPATIMATAYLIASSVALFTLVLYVLGRWTATAASLQFPISPLITVVAATTLAGESVRPLFLAGAALVAVGVVVASGVLDRRRFMGARVV